MSLAASSMHECDPGSSRAPLHSAAGEVPGPAPPAPVEHLTSWRLEAELERPRGSPAGARDTQGLRVAHGGSMPLRALPAPTQWSSGWRVPRGRASRSSSRGEPRRGSVTSAAHVNNAGGDWSRYAATLATETIATPTE